MSKIRMQNSAFCSTNLSNYFEYDFQRQGTYIIHVYVHFSMSFLSDDRYCNAEGAQNDTCLTLVCANDTVLSAYAQIQV